MGRQITYYYGGHTIDPTLYPIPENLRRATVFNIVYTSLSGKKVNLMNGPHQRQFLSQDLAKAHGDEQVTLGRWKGYKIAPRY